MGIHPRLFKFKSHANYVINGMDYVWGAILTDVWSWNKPSDIMKNQIECFLDIDFAGKYDHQKPTDPVCDKMQTEFVLTFPECDTRALSYCNQSCNLK